MNIIWENPNSALRDMQEEGYWIEKDGEIYFQKFPPIKYLRGGI